jgi:hypothetical protein
MCGVTKCDLETSTRPRPTRPVEPCKKNRISIFFYKIGWEVDRINLVQNSDKWGFFCEHGNEPSGSIKHGKICDELRNG